MYLRNAYVDRAFQAVERFVIFVIGAIPALCNGQDWASTFFQPPQLLYLFLDVKGVFNSSETPSNQLYGFPSVSPTFLQ